MRQSNTRKSHKVNKLVSSSLSGYSEWRITNFYCLNLIRKTSLFKLVYPRKIKIETLRLFWILFPEFGNMAHIIWVKK